MKHLTICALMAATAMPALASAAEVNVYTTRQPQLIEPILEDFTEATGIKVNTLFASKGLVERMKLEGANSPADIFLTADIGKVIAAVDAGITQPLKNETLEATIPADLRAPDGQWFGLTTRARIVYASNERVPEGAITTYSDLAAPQWNGKICTRSGTHSYNLSLVSAYLAHNGEAETKNWLEGLKANLSRKPQGNDRAQAKAIWAGECDIGIANTYYLGKMLENDEQTEWASSLRPVFLTFDKTDGTHMNVSGASLAAHAPNKAEAIQLLEYMVSDAAQQEYAQLNYEYPVKADVAISDLVKSWGTLTPDTLSLTEIAKRRGDALKLVEKVGFDQ